MSSASSGKLSIWGERALLVFLWGAVLPAMFIGALIVLGMMVEGVTEYRTELDRCQKQAGTHYEYHQCR